MGVTGEKWLLQEKGEQKQDFLVTSTDVFITKDIEEFDDLTKALTDRDLCKTSIAKKLILYNQYSKIYAMGFCKSLRQYFCKTVDLPDALAGGLESDPITGWSEAASPFQKVATIKILQQSFDTEKQREFGENLSFTLWHSLPEHRPLGSVNRAREVVYAIISIFQHQKNDARRKELTSWEI